MSFAQPLESHFQRWMSVSKRLEPDRKKQGYLRSLWNAQQASPLTANEQQVIDHARQLISGRGWPTERIQPFFLEPRDLPRLGAEIGASEQELDGVGLPACLGPTAVSIPRPAIFALNQRDATRVVVHEMVHARSQALPESGQIAADWYEDDGLYQLNEGITELIAEEIMPLSTAMAQCSPLLVAIRHWTQEICQRADVDVSDLERLSSTEALLLLSPGQDPEPLAAELKQRISAYRQVAF